MNVPFAFTPSEGRKTSAVTVISVLENEKVSVDTGTCTLHTCVCIQQQPFPDLNRTIPPSVSSVQVDSSEILIQISKDILACVM